MERDVRLAWAALRDCVKVGKKYRYTEAQLVYHYTKERAGLLQAVKAHQATGGGGGKRGKRAGKSWVATVGEVLLTLLLPLVLVLLATYMAHKKLPGHAGDDKRLHWLAK